jgi:hypothetical protein
MYADTEMAPVMLFGPISSESRPRYGKAKGGLVGMTLSADQVARWLLSYNLCQQVSTSLDKMFDDDEDEECDVKENCHKEEGANRKKLDKRQVESTEGT